MSGTLGPLNGPASCLSQGDSRGASLCCCSGMRDNIRLEMKYFLAFLFLTVNAFGQLFPSNTPVPVVAPVITSLAVTRYTMTVIWTEANNPQSPDWQNGYYVVSYGILPGTVTGSTSTNNTLTLSTVFSSLTPGTTYFVTVQYFVPSLNLVSPISGTASIKTWP